jgi:hypothetical protein
MSDRNERWSDLDWAKEASRRLGGQQDAASASPSGVELPPAASYTRFRAKARPGVAPAASPEAAAAPPPTSPPKPALPELPSEGVQSWSGLLAWAADAAGAESCFVVDSQGFVLAHHGDWSYEDIEDVGSQLTLIMTRADETEAAGRSRAITLEFGEHWLSGTRISFPDVGELTFVLISREALDRELILALARQVEEGIQRV